MMTGIVAVAGRREAPPAVRSRRAPASSRRSAQVRRAGRGALRAPRAVADGLDVSAPRAAGVRSRAYRRCRRRAVLRAVRGRRDAVDLHAPRLRGDAADSAALLSIRHRWAPAATAAPPRRMASAPVAGERGRRLGADPLRRQVRGPTGIATVNVVPDPGRAFDAGCCRRAACTSSCTKREPDAGALMRAARAPLDAMEALEQARQFLLGYAVPVSRTASSPSRPARAQSDAISPSNVNLKALDSRLSTIFSHMSRSTRPARGAVGQSTSNASPPARCGAERAGEIGGEAARSVGS